MAALTAGVGLMLLWNSPIVEDVASVLTGKVLKMKKLYLLVTKDEYEPRLVIRDWGLNFNLGSAVKYISRAGRKDNVLQDLLKAKQFIEFEIEAISYDKLIRTKIEQALRAEAYKEEGLPQKQDPPPTAALNIAIEALEKQIRGQALDWSEEND